MDYDISLLMASHIKSVREAGEYLYRLDNINDVDGLNGKQLEELIEILLKIEQEYQDGIKIAAL